MRRHSKYKFAAFVGLFLPLGACSNLSVPDTAGIFGSAQLAPQTGDACGKERAAFADSQSYFSANLVSETMMGGMKSVVSDLAGRLGNGSTSNLTTGLQRDAFSGARSGYLSALAKRSENQHDMVRQMNGDLLQESDQVDALNGSFQRLQSCRFQQAQLIKTKARSGRITAGEARDDLAVQRRLFDEELAKARQSGSNMERRDEQFQYAAQELNSPTQAPAVSQQTRHATDVATVTLPRKREAFVSAVSDAEVRSKSDLGDDVTAS